RRPAALLSMNQASRRAEHDIGRGRAVAGRARNAGSTEVVGPAAPLLICGSPQVGRQESALSAAKWHPHVIPSQPRLQIALNAEHLDGVYFAVHVLQL